MEIFQMPAKISWKIKLENMEVGEELRVPLYKRSTLAPLISREIKLRYPEREYPTDCTSIPDVMIITRTA